jgi:hypothetical protein
LPCWQQGKVGSTIAFGSNGSHHSISGKLVRTTISALISKPVKECQKDCPDKMAKHFLKTRPVPKPWLEI